MGDENSRVPLSSTLWLNSSMRQRADEEEDNEDTPLVFVCRRHEVPLDDCESLIDQCSEDGVLVRRGNRRSTVLHDACKLGASVDVFLLLSDRFPAAIRFTDWFNDTPLHNACRYGKDSVASHRSQQPGSNAALFGVCKVRLE
jgi:hypothetical protein